MPELSNLSSLLNSGTLYIILIAFIIISYLLLSLFNWSFIKPIKYMGIIMIIVGILLNIIRFTSGSIIKVLLSEFTIPTELIGIILKPIFIMGIIYIVLGIVLIVIEHLIIKKRETKNTKKKK